MVPPPIPIPGPTPPLLSVEEYLNHMKGPTMPPGPPSSEVLAEDLTIPNPPWQPDYPIAQDEPSSDSLFTLQIRRDEWGQRWFPPEVLHEQGGSPEFKPYFSKVEYAFRFLEEAIELAQAMGLTVEEVVKQADVVYSKAPGNLSQEIAGTVVTLLALSSSQNVSVSDVTLRELARIEDPAVAQRIVDRQAEKRANGLTDTIPL
jgi:hypothetical protein